MTSKIWNKPQTQQIIKALRDSGVNVLKINSGYEAKDKNGNVIFKAMQGYNGYLVRHVDNLFVEA